VLGRSRASGCWGELVHIHTLVVVVVLFLFTQSSESVRGDGRDSRDLTSEMNCDLQVNELLFLVVGVKVGSESCCWMLLRVACLPVRMKGSLLGCVVIVR